MAEDANTKSADQTIVADRDLSPVQVNGLAFKQLKHGVTTWPSNGVTESKMIELATELRSLCAANRKKNIIFGTNAMPRCTCPFSAANNTDARIPWCALYGIPIEWAYFEESEKVGVNNEH